MVLQLLCDHRYVSMRQFVVYKLRNIVPISVAKFNVFTREMVKKSSFLPSELHGLFLSSCDLHQRFWDTCKNPEILVSRVFSERKI